MSRSNELPLHLMQDRFNRRMEQLLRPAFMRGNYKMSEKKDDGGSSDEDDAEQLSAEPSQIHSAVQQQGQIGRLGGATAGHHGLL